MSLDQDLGGSWQLRGDHSNCEQVEESKLKSAYPPPPPDTSSATADVDAANAPRPTTTHAITATARMLPSRTFIRTPPLDTACSGPSRSA